MAGVTLTYAANTPPRRYGVAERQCRQMRETGPRERLVEKVGEEDSQADIA